MTKLLFGYVAGLVTVVALSAYVVQGTQLQCDVHFNESSMTKPCSIANVIVLGVQL